MRFAFTLGITIALACAATTYPADGPPPFYADRMKLLVWRDADGKEHPITRADDWAKRRAHILANMQLVMGPLPEDGKKVPLDVKVTDEKKLDKCVRKKSTFATEKNDRVPAFLFIPLEIKGKVPAMLCLHQTVKIGKEEPAGLGGSPNLHYALHLAERGYVTLAPDYPYLGENSFDPYKNGYESGCMKAIWNNMRAIDLLQSMAEVDAEKVGCIGHSLGGHTTMFTAVFDLRIRAIISSCGFNNFPKHHKGDLKAWTGVRYMPRIEKVYELKPEKVPFDFQEVLAALAPRPFFSNSPLEDDDFEVSGVRDCVAAAQPVYNLLGAKEKLTVVYPNCKHDFPPQVRKQAYDWLDNVLKK